MRGSTFRSTKSLYTIQLTTLGGEAAGKVLFTKSMGGYRAKRLDYNGVDLLRKAHEKRQWCTRLDLVQQIIGGEQKSYQLLRDREKLFEQARVKESAWWDKAEDQIKIDFKNMLAKRDEERVVALQLAAEKAVKQLPVLYLSLLFCHQSPKLNKLKREKRLKMQKKWLNIRFKSVLSEMVC